jgi:hemoglobin
MNLFQKYGGTATVSRIVADFYREILTRSHLKSYFDGVPLQKLIQHQVRFMSQVMGQVPGAYNGRAMDEAHQRLNISDAHFAEVAQILENVLRKAGMEPADLLKIMAAVAGLQSAVVRAVPQADAPGQANAV